jgi:protein tyrosine phosphatase
MSCVMQYCVLSCVLPDDATRVRLSGVDDYINASHVSYRIPNVGEAEGNCDRQYIAAQDPLPHTIVDFWRMTWEYRITLIVAVQSSVPYWPEDVDTCLAIGSELVATCV